MDLEKLEQLFAKLGGSVRGLNTHISALNKAMNALPESSQSAAQSIMDAAEQKYKEIAAMEQTLSQQMQKQEGIISERTYTAASRRSGKPVKYKDPKRIAENAPIIEAAEKELANLTKQRSELAKDVVDLVKDQKNQLKDLIADEKKQADKERDARKELLGEIKTVATRYRLMDSGSGRPIGYRKLLDPEAAALLDEGMALTSRKEREGSAFKLSKEQQELINVTKLYTDELRKQEKAMSAGYTQMEKLEAAEKKAKRDEIDLMHKEALQMNKDLDFEKKQLMDKEDAHAYALQIEKNLAEKRKEAAQKEAQRMGRLEAQAYADDAKRTEKLLASKQPPAIDPAKAAAKAAREREAAEVKLVKAIRDRIRAGEKLNETQIDLIKNTEKLTKEGGQLNSVQRRLASSLSLGTKNLKIQNDQVSLTSKSYDGLGKTISRVRNASLLFFFAFRPLVDFFKSAITTTREYEKALNGINSISRKLGATSAETTTALDTLTKDGLLSVAEAGKSLRNLMAFGFDMPQAIEIIKNLTNAAAFNRQGTLELGEAVVGATDGIKNMISRMVDNAGVTKNLSIMFDEYGATIGKTGESLSRLEQRQAIYNGIQKETVIFFGDSMMAADTLDGSLTRLNRSWEQLTYGFVATAHGPIQGIVKGLTSIVDKLREVINLKGSGKNVMEALEMAGLGDSLLYQSLQADEDRSSRFWTGNTRKIGVDPNRLFGSGAARMGVKGSRSYKLNFAEKNPVQAAFTKAMAENEEINSLRLALQSQLAELENVTSSSNLLSNINTEKVTYESTNRVIEAIKAYSDAVVTVQNQVLGEFQVKGGKGRGGSQATAELLDDFVKDVNAEILRPLAITTTNIQKDPEFRRYRDRLTKIEDGDELNKGKKGSLLDRVILKMLGMSDARSQDDAIQELRQKIETQRDDQIMRLNDAFKENKLSDKFFQKVKMEGEAQKDTIKRLTNEISENAAKELENGIDEYYQKLADKLTKLASYAKKTEDEIISKVEARRKEDELKVGEIKSKYDSASDEDKETLLSKYRTSLGLLDEASNREVFEAIDTMMRENRDRFEKSLRLKRDLDLLDISRAKDDSDKIETEISKLRSKLGTQQSGLQSTVIFDKAFIEKATSGFLSGSTKKNLESFLGDRLNSIKLFNASIEDELVELEARKGRLDQLTQMKRVGGYDEEGARLLDDRIGQAELSYNEALYALLQKINEEREKQGLKGLEFLDDLENQKLGVNELRKSITGLGGALDTITNSGDKQWSRYARNINNVISAVDNLNTAMNNVSKASTVAQQAIAGMSVATATLTAVATIVSLFSDDDEKRERRQRAINRQNELGATINRGPNTININPSIVVSADGDVYFGHDSIEVVRDQLIDQVQRAYDFGELTSAS